MPTAETEAWQIATADATDADGGIDESRRFAIFKGEYERRISERRERLTRDTQAVFRAMDGWSRVETMDAWHETVDKAAADLETGGFFIERLGSERYLDPAFVFEVIGIFADDMRRLGCRVVPERARVEPYCESRVETARDMLNGMMWILMTGAPWRDLPERYGHWETVYRRFREWDRAGVLDRMLERLRLRLDEYLPFGLDAGTIFYT